MQDKAGWDSHRALVLNTMAFTICFAVWMLNGVLVTYLSSHQVFDWSPSQVGWLMGIPVLTGALGRLPAGVLADKFGGKPVFAGLLFVCAIPMYLLSHADSFTDFALCSFGFGLSGAGFAIGISHTSLLYPKTQQGFALGVFGAGNAGAAITTLIAPAALNEITNGGMDLEAWRVLPSYYAITLVLMGTLYLLLARNAKPETSTKTISRMLQPLKRMRIWRFGLYYFLVFGCFVAFSQWLVPYFVNVYETSLVTAGILAACFSFPSGVIRALGGWISDKVGARTVMYWVMGSSLVISLLIVVPRMTIDSPGLGIMASRAGVVAQVSSDAVVIAERSPTGTALGQRQYALKTRPDGSAEQSRSTLILPTKSTWQEPKVKVGQTVKRRMLLAKGHTRIFFQANMWVFAALVVMLGLIWGIGKAAVYKHIPDYFPEEVGVVGGMVGVLGGLGGFFCPILFGYLLEETGLWTSCWMFMALVSGVCLVWMHLVIRRMEKERTPETAQWFEMGLG